MNNPDQHQRSFLENGRYSEEHDSETLSFPGGALVVVVIVTGAIVGIFALKNAVAELFNSIPFLAQYIS